MISYNDIYEILRKEKYSEVLQQLPKNFIEDFSNEKRMSSISSPGKAKIYFTPSFSRHCISRSDVFIKRNNRFIPLSD